MRLLHTGIVFILLLICPDVAHSQYWMQRGGGLAIDEASDIASDSGNNTFTTGYFTFTASFESNALSSAGLEDIFILKTDASGNIVWLKSAGGSGVDRALAIDADASGNTVVTGYYSNAATFDSQTLVSAGQRDIFIAKYNSSGNLLWVESAGGANADAGNSVSFDGFGNVIVTGEFSGSCSFGSTTLTSMNGSIDIFIAKYDSNGNFIWAKQGSGNNTDRGTGVSVDASANIYVTGIFSDTITFDQVHYNTVFNSVFLIKYDSSGQEQWFRWMGSPSVIDVGGISVHNNDINLTGSFGNAVYFYGGTGTPLIIGSYANNIFICRYDLSGNLIWKHADGSSSPVSSEAISTNSNGEVAITGNFKCRFSDFSLQYGSGTFCSLGYWDTYVASYDNNGNWLWARSFGGHQDDFANGITVSPNGNIATTGSFKERFFSTYDSTAFTPHGFLQVDFLYQNLNSLTYCSDAQYYNFINLYSHGNSDVFINSNINLNRQPYDFFKRTGTACNRPFFDMCVNPFPFGPSCPDTLSVCGGTGLIANLGNYYDPLSQDNVTPEYHFQWSNGNTSQGISFNGNGYCYAQANSTDGCFVNNDSVYVINSPPPVDPAITDSKGININTTLVQNIPFCIFPDSVDLTCTNVGTTTVHWLGFPIGQNPVTVNNPGNYKCVLSNQYGCTSEVIIKVVTGQPFVPIVPEMICLNDSDQNDTVEVCLGSTFNMFVYDTISNPGANTNACIPDTLTTTFSWNTSFNSNVIYNSITSCPNGGFNSFTCSQLDSFLIDVSVTVNRGNPCYFDTVTIHKQIYVIVRPTPSGNVTFNVSGPSYMCPGDTVTLVATPPGYVYSWTTGSTVDSTIITQPGTYIVIASQTLTNSYGCSTIVYGFKTITVQPYPQPVLTMAPINGVVCPGDSVYLMSSGAGTVISWEGPNGSFGANEQNIFVYTPGTYYYIMEVSPGCTFVSNSIQIISYSTPTLLAIPGTSLCLADSITLQIITDSLGSWILWDAPFNDHLLSHVVDSPGTYSCFVDQCLIITPLSITITKDTADAIIYSAGGNTFCNGDSILLTANSGMATYQWLPQGIFADSVYITQPGTYTLITTSAGGCSDSAQINITAVANTLNLPLINDTNVCSGYSVLLNAISNDSVYWNSSPSYSSWINSGNFYQTPSLQTPITYYVFTQSGVCHSAFDSLTVSINPDSAIAIISASATSVCSGDSILLTANSGMNSYEWLPIGVFNDSIYVLQTGNYSLVTMSASGCADTAQMAVTIVPNTLTPPLIADTAVCKGGSILLNAMSNDSVYWNTSASYSGWFNVGNFYQTPSLQNAVTYYLFTQNGACKSVIDSVTIGISLDTAIAVINSSATTICSGDSVLLTANAGMSTYLWLPMGIFSNSIYVTQTGNYSLITTSAFGCMDTTQISVSVVQNNLIPPLIHDTTICSGNSVLLNAISSDSVYWSSIASYSGWFNTGNFYQTPALQSSITYYLFTQSGVCKSAMDSVTVGISTDTAVAIINSSATTFCNGDSILLTANNGMVTYQWLPQGIFADSIYVFLSGNYLLVATSNFGCTDTSGLAITAIPNTLSPPLISDTTLCKGDSVLLNALSINPVFWSNSLSYSNVFNAGNIFITPPLQLPVTYYLFTSDGLCRSNFDSVTVSLVDNCDSVIENIDVFLPNIFTPNDDGINDYFPGSHGNYTIDLKIYNRWGGIVFNDQELIQGWNGYISAGKKAADGTYYCIAVFNFVDGTSKKLSGSFLLVGN